jgi:hypothetical protein
MCLWPPDFQQGFQDHSMQKEIMLGQLDVVIQKKKKMNLDPSFTTHKKINSK